MKLSDNTYNVLKNFAQINGNILIDAGTALKSVNESQTIFAEAVVQDSFPVEVGIYDLPEFLNICGLVGEPASVEFDFQPNHVLVSNGKTKVKYWYAAKKVLKYPEKNINMPEPIVQFDISDSVFAKVRRAAGVFGHPALSFYSQDGNIFAKVYDPQSSSSNVLEEEIGEVPDGSPTFDFVFAISNLKTLPESSGFNVAFASKGKSKIARFSSSTQPIKYYIAVESISSVEE